MQRAVDHGHISKQDLARRQYEPSAGGGGSAQATLETLFSAMEGHKVLDMNHFARKLIRNAVSNDQAGRRDRDTTVGRRSTFTRRSTYNRKSMFSSRNSTYSGDATSRSRRSLLPWRLRHPSLQRQPTGTSLMGSDGRPVTPPSNMKRPTGAPVASGQASTKPKPAGTVKFTDFAASLEESTINRESSAMTEDSALPSAATPGWPMAGIAEAPSEDEKVDIQTSGSSPHTA